MGHPVSHGRGLSQAALATRGHLLRNFSSRIENGAAHPELDMLGKITAAFGGHPRELLEE